MASTDRVTWKVRSRIEAYDVAVDPERSDTVLATTEQGVQRSTDGGRTWSAAGGSAVLLHWSERDRLVAVAADGQILRSADGGETWSPTGGRAPGAPAAFTVCGETVYVAIRGRLRRVAAVGSWARFAVSAAYPEVAGQGSASPGPPAPTAQPREAPGGGGV